MAGPAQETRDWILFTDEQPTVPVYAGFTPQETKQALRQKMEPSYMGTFSSAKRHVMHSFATTQSPMMKRRAAQYMLSSLCPVCDGKRLRREALSVSFEGYDIAQMTELSMSRLSAIFSAYADGTAPSLAKLRKESPQKALVVDRIASDLCSRLSVLLDLGLGYLSMNRSTPTLSPGELQRLRLATQVVSNLFGVVYVLDEPTTGLHASDVEKLIAQLQKLVDAGNSVVTIEHEMRVAAVSDWIIDIGPGAGEKGGQLVAMGAPQDVARAKASHTAPYLARFLSDGT